jgi:hypothetical protein
VGVVWAAMRVGSVGTVRLRQWWQRLAVFGCVGAVVDDSRVLAERVHWRAAGSSFAMVTFQSRSLLRRWMGGRLEVVLSF